MNADQSQVTRHGSGGDARFVRRLRGTVPAPAPRSTQPKRAAQPQPNPADTNGDLV